MVPSYFHFPISIIMRKKILLSAVAAVVIIITAIAGASVYMLDYSLASDPNRHDVDSAYKVLYHQIPDMKPWIDSLRNRKLLRDTFVTMPSGERHHAILLRNDSAHGRTAVIVHGYKDCSIKFLYLGRMYHRDLGFNILLPDLHGHGLSEGDNIQMGWKDRLDIKRWTEIAAGTFADSTHGTSVVVHGVSMGAATTMCLSGEALPDYVRCFVEDCGYTSVWDEFSGQLSEQFGLPEFPLLYSTSILCRLVNGWSFGEASPLRQVAKCNRPMLFIHGDADTFVPFSMMQRLYDAKRGEKEMWIAKGTHHAASYLDYPHEYTEKVRDFLNVATLHD